MWGVMLPAFGLAYVAKWVRRSNVITGAEWMVTRFGDRHGGKAARMAYALMAVVTCVSFIGYAFQGIGKFARIYIDTGWLVQLVPAMETLLTTYKPQTMAVAILSLTTLYVVLGGLVGVIVTDVIQTLVLSLACLVIGWVAFTKVSPEMVRQAVPAGWESLRPVWRIAVAHGVEHVRRLLGRQRSVPVLHVPRGTLVWAGRLVVRHLRRRGRRAVCHLVSVDGRCA